MNPPPELLPQHCEKIRPVRRLGVVGALARVWPFRVEPASARSVEAKERLGRDPARVVAEDGRRHRRSWRSPKGRTGVFEHAQGFSGYEKVERAFESPRNSSGQAGAKWPNSRLARLTILSCAAGALCLVTSFAHADEAITPVREDGRGEGEAVKTERGAPANVSKRTTEPGAPAAKFESGVANDKAPNQGQGRQRQPRRIDLKPRQPLASRKPGGAKTKADAPPPVAKKRAGGLGLPPRTVSLPMQGVYRAAELIALAAKLQDLPLRTSNEQLGEIRIAILPDLAGARITLSELRVLLAAHRIYLLEVDDPRGERFLVATDDPRWRPRALRHTYVLEVSDSRFAETEAALAKRVATYNAQRPKGELPAAVVGAPRMGRILLRAGSAQALEELVAVAEEHTAVRLAPDPDRPKMFIYTGRNRRIGELKEHVLKELSEVERAQTRCITRGNRLLFRAAPKLGERILRLLREADVRASR